MSIHEAIRNDDQSLLESLLNGSKIPEYKDKDGRSLLHLAAHCGNARLVKRFIEAGCQVNLRHSNDTPPLMFILEDGDVTKRPAIVELLVKAGADVKFKNCNKDTALHFCFPERVNGQLQRHDLNTAKLLLDNGADVNSQGYHGFTPLHKAARVAQLDSIEFLLSHRADVNIVNDNKETALHLAVRELYDKESTPKTDHDAALKTVTTLLAHGANINVKNYEDQTPFHLIVKEGSEKHVQLFLDHGADLNVKDEENRGPIHFAAMNESVDVLRLLLDNGCDVDERTDSSETPLHHAAKCGLRENIKLLHDRGADINARTIHGETPLHEFILSLDNSVLASKIFNGPDHPHYLLDFFVIELGADVNAVTLKKRTILDMANRFYFKEYKQLILSFLAKLRFYGKSLDAHLINQIKNQADDKEYFEKSIVELYAIKNFTFSNGAPLLPIFMGDEEDMANYACNEDLVKEFCAMISFAAFPIYTDILVKKFTPAMAEHKKD